MQESNDNNNESLTPYKASGNLNTSIGIPHMDVNDPMNINIQNVNTNSSMMNNVDNNYQTNNFTNSNIDNNDNITSKNTTIRINFSPICK